MSKTTLTLDENTAIHCPTQALAEKVSQYVPGINPTFWKYCNENTCLYSRGVYGALDYAKVSNHKVVTAEEVIAHFENPDLYSRLVKPEVAIHCETKEEAEQLLKWAHSQGLKWNTKKSYLSGTAYDIHKDKTCYSLYTGRYTEVSFYKSEGYKIIKFSSIPEFQTKPSIEDLNPGTGENIEKHPITSMKPEDTPLTEFHIGDLIYWTEYAESRLLSAKAKKLVGKVVSIEKRKHTSPLIKYEDTEKQLGSVDSGWVTTVPPVLVKYAESKVAQQEPNQLTITEESFMSKLRSTALTTVEQNKEAAIIAAKMEAGRIITKQVIKQAAKHVPFWAKGYLDTPLAPVILANGVAMLGNHTGNPKVQKVAEFMLLAAADTTVQSFNLDKIIDDVLSGVKLPAGIFDEDKE